MANYSPGDHDASILHTDPNHPLNYLFPEDTGGELLMNGERSDATFVGATFMAPLGQGGATVSDFATSIRDGDGHRLSLPAVLDGIADEVGALSLWDEFVGRRNSAPDGWNELYRVDSIEQSSQKSKHFAEKDNYTPALIPALSGQQMLATYACAGERWDYLPRREEAGVCQRFLIFWGHFRLS